MASQGDGQQPSASVACPHRHQVELAEGYIRVMDKGRKERVVPLGRAATERLQRYLEKAWPYPSSPGVVHGDARRVYDPRRRGALEGVVTAVPKVSNRGPMRTVRRLSDGAPRPRLPPR